MSLNPNTTAATTFAMWWIAEDTMRSGRIVDPAALIYEELEEKRFLDPHAIATAVYAGKRVLSECEDRKIQCNIGDLLYGEDF
jgi:hypothetical protein